MLLIEQRAQARISGDEVEKARLHREVKVWAKRDRTIWMEKMLEDGSWQSLKKIRRPKPPKRLKLRDHLGELVECSKWADTMARHLETVQWKVRPCGIIDGPSLGNLLPVS